LINLLDPIQVFCNQNTDNLLKILKIFLLIFLNLKLGAVNMKEINGEFLYRWDINKYHLLNEPLTVEKEKKEKVKQEFIPKYY